MQIEDQTPLSLREKLVIILVVFLCKVIRPWQYDHQFKEFWDEIKKLSN